MRQLLRDFRAFAFKGNLIELAVAFILGAAFTVLVQAVVADLITPIIGIFSSSRDFSRLAFHIRGSRFAYGDFINKLIAFLITAWVLFLIIKSVTRFYPPPAAPRLRECAYCREMVAASASRCAHCTSELTPAV
ncbi:MAG TPA: large conductance mechanosensitive channel protein MscL [Solirubrobacteraceae bacterium]|nr:large conductance mechanosensitive channel protein MscL [Solirubrobacteraceae bacterium]